MAEETNNGGAGGPGPRPSGQAPLVATDFEPTRIATEVPPELLRKAAPPKKKRAPKPKPKPKPKKKARKATATGRPKPRRKRRRR